MNDDRLRLAFCGLHPDRTRDLVASYGSPGEVLYAIGHGRVKVSERVREVAGESAESLRARLPEGVRAVLRAGAGYPKALEELPTAPDVLFVQGEVPTTPAVAVVGTRRCTRYGRGLAHAFGRAIAEAGWATVSGLARGIDGAAHEGTVAGSGPGVGVLGSGPDVWYPREHRALAQELISSGGAVVTEYPPETPPEGWRFPPRNRIISGLAEAVIVVEAGETGGALITAAAALEQGRNVFAVPGDIDRESSRGCNLLIRDGAQPVLGPEDLIEGLSFILGPPPQPPPNEVDGELLESLSSGRSIAELAELSGESLPGLLATLARLEADGSVTRRGDRFIVKPGIPGER